MDGPDQSQQKGRACSWALLGRNSVLNPCEKLPLLLPPPSLPSSVAPSLSLPPRPQTLPQAPSLGFSIARGDAAVVGVGLRMALGSFAGARCPLKMTMLFGAGSLSGVGPVLSAQLVWAWHPCPGSTCLVPALGLPLLFHVPSRLSPI